MQNNNIYPQFIFKLSIYVKNQRSLDTEKTGWEKIVLVTEHYDCQPGPATDTEYSVAELKNTRLMSWHCNKTRTACNSLSQNKTWKSLGTVLTDNISSSKPAHSSWSCRCCLVLTHQHLSQLQVFHDSSSTHTTHNKMHFHCALSWKDTCRRPVKCDLG